MKIKNNLLKRGQSELSVEEALHGLEYALQTPLNQIVVSNGINIEASNHVANVENPTKVTYANYLQIWKDFFIGENITDISSFVNLGGDSLTAIGLADQIHKKLGLTISPYLILELEDPLSIYQSICKDKKNLIELVRVNNTAENINKIIFIHPAYGEVDMYQKLIQPLHLQVECYALKNNVLESSFYSTIEDMINHYVEMIQSQFSKEHILTLAGWSLGGNVAAGIATQLQQKGYNVKLVCLFDSWAHYSKRLTDRDYFESCQVSLAQSNWNEVLWHYTQILLAYSPPKIDCPVVLFKVEDLLDEYLDIASDDNGWQGYCNKPLTIIPVSGNHRDLFNRPNIKQLQIKFNNVLQALAVC